MTASRVEISADKASLVSPLFTAILKCFYQARRVRGHTYVCYWYRFFYWILTLFRGYGILFIFFIFPPLPPSPRVSNSNGYIVPHPLFCVSSSPLFLTEAVS